MSDPVEIVYNDACPVCRAEVNRHAATADPARLRFTPVREADLDALGVTEEQALRRLHARQGDRVMDGLDANRAMWAQARGFGWLSRVTGWPVVRPVAAAVYDRVLAPALYRMHLRRERRRGG